MKVVVCSIGLVTAVLTTQAFAENWLSVPETSQLEFIATFEGAEAAGEFRQFKVVVDFDPQSLAASSLVVVVSTATASMGNGEIDEEIAQQAWFNVVAFPDAQFRSEKIYLRDNSDYFADGVLVLKGVAKPVTVPFHWSQDDGNAEMTGAVTLSRLDFGIGSGEWETDSSIGHDVQVRFRILLAASE